VRSGETRTLVEGGHAALVRGQQLFFTRRDALYVAAFDLASLRTTGEPRFLFDGLRTTDLWQPAWFDIAQDGTLVFLPGGVQGGRRELVTIGDDGAATPFVPGVRAYDGMLALDAEGTFLTLAMTASSGLIEVWGTEVSAPSLRPLVATPRADVLPGPIDTRTGFLYFTRIAQGTPARVWRAPLGAPEREEPVGPGSERDLFASGLTPDGRALVLVAGRGPSADILQHPLDGGGEPRELLQDAALLRWIGHSRDGQWLAYQSGEDGLPRVVIRRVRSDGSLGPRLPLPGFEGEGVGQAVWSRAAATPTLLLQLEEPQRIFEVELGGEAPAFSTPRLRAVLPDARLISFTSLSDGRLLCVLRGAEERRVERIDVLFGALELSDE
jgi:hypothetical protein